MLNFGNKEFRNLQEQVLQNANDLQEIKQSLGDSLPNPIPGPQGPVGPQGPQGVPGQNVNFTVGTNLPASANTGDLHLKFNGELYMFTPLGWTLRTNLKGPQGVKGEKGDRGLQGIQGMRGPQGEQGIAAPIYKVVGKVYDVSQLPDPSTVAPNSAYIVSTDIYGQVNDQWNNFGPLVTLEIAANVSFNSYYDLTATNVQDAIEQTYEYINNTYRLADQANGRSNSNATEIEEIKENIHKALTLNALDTAQFDQTYALSAYATNSDTYTDLDLFYNTYDTLNGVYDKDFYITTPDEVGFVNLHKGEYVFRKVGCATTTGLDGNPYITHITYQTELSEYSNREISLALRITKSEGNIYLEPRYSFSPEENRTVNTDQDQTITGAKTFTEPVRLGSGSTSVKITNSNGNLKLTDNGGNGQTFISPGLPTIATYNPVDGRNEYNLSNFATTDYVDGKLDIWVPNGTRISTTITSATGKSWECQYQVLKNTLTNKWKVEYTLYSLTEETATAELISFNLLTTITIGATYKTDTIGYANLPKPIEGDTYWTFDGFTFDESSDVGNQCTPLPFRGSGGFETRMLVIDSNPPASITFKKVIANVSLYEK